MARDDLPSFNRSPSDTCRESKQASAALARVVSAGAVSSPSAAGRTTPGSDPLTVPSGATRRAAPSSLRSVE